MSPAQRCAITEGRKRVEDQDDPDYDGEKPPQQIDLGN